MWWESCRVRCAHPFDVHPSTHARKVFTGCAFATITRRTDMRPPDMCVCVLSTARTRSSGAYSAHMSTSATWRRRPAVRFVIELYTCGTRSRAAYVSRTRCSLAPLLFRTHIQCVLIRIAPHTARVRA